MIIFFTLICTLGAVYKAYRTTPIYLSEVLLESRFDNNIGADLKSKLGGLTDLAEFDKNQSGSPIDISLAILKSRTFKNSFIRDAKNIADFNLEITKNGGLIALSVQSPNREQTAWLANTLVKRINRYMCNRLVEDARRIIEKVEVEIERTSVVSHKQILVNLLSDQVRTIMMTNLKTDFPFRIIDSAIVPPENSYIEPKRKEIIARGFGLGVFLGGLAAFFRNSLRRDGKEAEGRKDETGLNVSEKQNLPVTIQPPRK